MKRFVALCLTLVLLLGVLPLPQAEAASLTLTVTGGWLRLRDEASFNGDTIASYYSGTKVTVLGTSGAWYRVRTPDGNVGYMYGKYLTSSGTGSSGSAAQNITAYVTSENGKGVRLRTGPGTGYGVIRQYAVGTKVTILSAGTYWHYVSIDGQKGYMMADYLTTKPVTPAPAPEPDDDVDVAYTAYVTSENGKSVRLRKGAGKSYAVIGSYAVGTEVLVHGKSGSWSQITVQGVQGYMMSQYLTTEKPDASAPEAPDFTAYTAYVTSSNGKGVNLRKGPSTSRSSLGVYDVGTAVTVLGETGSWSYIQIGSVKGYMMSKYLTAEKPGGSGNQTPDFTAYTAYVTSSNGKGVNMRKGPSTSQASLGLYDVGTAVTVLGVTGSWSYIQIGSVKGYMMSQYLTTQQPGSSGSTSGSYTAYVTSENGKGVYLRKGAGKNYASVGFYSVGTKVTVLKHNTTWDYVRIGSREGYMMNQFLTTTAPGSRIVSGVTLSNAYPVPGETLWANVTPDGANVTYEWMTDNGLLLATTASLTLKEDDVGLRIRVRVTGTNGYTGSAVSAYATVQKPGGQANVLKSVAIDNNTPAVGQTLTAALQPEGATASYRWMRGDGKQVGSAKAYTVQPADVGYALWVEATGTGSYSGTVISSKTAPVKDAAADKPFSGTVSLNFSAIMPGVTLKPSVNVNCASITYHWYVGGVEVSNASQLSVTQAMAGKEIRLVVRPAAGSGFAGQVESNVCTVLSSSIATPTDL